MEYYCCVERYALSALEFSLRRSGDFDDRSKNFLWQGSDSGPDP